MFVTARDRCCDRRVFLLYFPAPPYC